jgi:predicted translin family RNA/ssDNA-binding protein
MYQGKLLFDDKLSEEELRPDPALIAMFERMRREMDEADEARQRFIRQMRDIERVSKHSIFALQRRDVQKGSHMIGTAAALVANMRMELLNSADPLMGSRAFEGALVASTPLC